MHRFLKKSTVHEKQGLLSVIQDDRNVPIAIDTAVTSSHHDDTTSEPLIQLAHAHACTYIFDYYLLIRTYERSLRGCAGGGEGPKICECPPPSQ